MSSPGIRYISFLPETSNIGLRLAGGNKYGLFICEIQANSAAAKANLFIADKIFNVNHVDFTHLTREEAVVYLINMKTSKINMIVSNCPCGLFVYLIEKKKMNIEFRSRIRTIVIRCRRRFILCPVKNSFEENHSRTDRTSFQYAFRMSFKGRRSSIHWYQ